MKKNVFLILIILLVGSLFFSSNVTAQDLLEPPMDDGESMIEKDIDLSLGINNETFYEEINPS